MIFEIHAEKNSTDKKIFFYDNIKNILKESNGDIFQLPPEKQKTPNKKPVVAFDKNTPLKKFKKVRVVKIQMGLSCNYSCDYCSQKFVERPKETSKKDIDNFMELFNNLEFSEETGLKVEFWGGEPFVYWKTMKPLAEAIREKFADWKKQPQFSVITNGSLLTEDVCAWLYAMGFSVSISHDGPGQFVRGPDPFDDPEIKQSILDLYSVLKPSGKISFNAMLNSKNLSRKAIHDWFIDFTGDQSVSLGEGGFVDAYDEDGLENSLNTFRQKFEFRQQAFGEIYGNKGYIGFFGVLKKIDNFISAVLNHRDAMYLGQKCGMDEEDTISFDLRGNVITCQNVSALETSKNGEPHLGGNISDLDSVEIKSATHWLNRKECSGCPVLHICQGACMFLDGKYWETSCNNAFSDAIPLFAAAFEKITDGYIPTLINNKELPLDRQDIWGNIYEHKEKEVKKIIPIKLITDRKTIVEGIEVYDKSIIIEGETQ
jgi:uncharacterized protein